MNDFFGYSETQILRELGERFRVYRQTLGMRQKDIAFQSGISEQTIKNFENGKAVNLTTVNLLKLLNAIGQRKNADLLLPEIPNPCDYADKQIQRIKSKKAR